MLAPCPKQRGESKNSLSLLQYKQHNKMWADCMNDNYRSAGRMNTLQMKTNHTQKQITVMRFLRLIKLLLKFID